MENTEKPSNLRDEITSAFDAEVEAPKEEPKEEPKVEAPKEEPKAEESKAEELSKKSVPEKGPDGKFKKATPPDKLSPEAAQPEAKPEGVAPKPQPTSFRAPGSWKPTAREKWSSVPPEVQQEILRRERDMANGFNEVGEIKKFRDSFHQLLQPYSNIIAAEGNNPMKFIGDLFSTAQVLYHGSPSQKVNTVAAFIRNFGVDLKMLDDVLASQTPAAESGGGRQVAPDSGYIDRLIEARLAPILQGQNAQTQQQVNAELQAFAEDPANEWFEDVRETMADLMEVASKQGKIMDLLTAYNRAILMHDDIANVVQERKLQEKAAQASATAQAARSKAVSVTGAPARESGAESGSLRDAIISAYDSQT